MSDGRTAMSDVLAALDPSTTTLQRLRDRLAVRAVEEDLLDLGYTTVPTPVGSLLLVASPAGLMRVAFEREGHEQVLARLAVDVGPRILHAPELLATAAAQVTEYFAGRRRRFELDLDLARTRGFRRQVLDRLAGIEYGATLTYAEVAAAAGSPRAVRAVGTACATNPLPIVVPCHRVVRSDGTTGGYLGGPDAKRALLAFERGAA